MVEVIKCLKRLGRYYMSVVESPPFQYRIELINDRLDIVASLDRAIHVLDGL